MKVARGAAGAARVRLTVEDSGPGMAEADMQRLGERFFRVIGSGQERQRPGLVDRAPHRRRCTARSRRARRSARLGGLAVEVVWPPAA